MWEPAQVIKNKIRLVDRIVAKKDILRRTRKQDNSMAEPSKQDSTVNALGAGANLGTAIDDSRRVQKTLIDTKIPIKRSH